MACLGVRYGLKFTTQDPFLHPGHVSAKVVKLTSRVSLPRCSPAKMAVAQCLPISDSQFGSGLSATQVNVGGGTNIGRREKLDRWVNESVVEIVKNLTEAPLFVHVYGGDPGTRLKTERAVAEDWAQLKGTWMRGEETSPAGIILVEELKEISEEDEGQNGENTKAWGVLVQGKGEDGGIACYLLKTSRVDCSNLGLFCTHYCLVRVKSLRETAKSQLTNCWLVQGQ